MDRQHQETDPRRGSVHPEQHPDMGWDQSVPVENSASWRDSGGPSVIGGEPAAGPNQSTSAEDSNAGSRPSIAATVIGLVIVIAIIVALVVVLTRLD